MSASDNSLPANLEQVLQADRFRLKKAWQRIRSRSSPLNEAQHQQELEKWQARVEASARLVRQRGDSIPQLTYDPELPIAGHREQLIELIRSRQTIVVCGETGSGKSTQLPKVCLEAGYGRSGMIGHTQPRRLAARAVSSRLAEELGTRVGELVGYKIRFTDSTRPTTLIKLMTDGVLLAETQSDRFLDQYEVIIVDEAHERSLNIDFLLGYLRQLGRKRSDLKLIITSATIDPRRFAEHFSDAQGPAPIVEVSGRTYPVDVRYRPPQQQVEQGDVDEQVQLSAIADAADELISERGGDILVFLPTERDIRAAAKYLRGHFTRLGRENSIEILPLYARLSQAEQNKIFAKHSRRRMVLATNVAESSLTVPGIHSVIDTGLARISRYAPRSKVQRLPIEDISAASANQRAGRCGRLGPGVCIRLFSEEDFDRRPKFTTPEIRRSDLASVLLQSLMLRLGPLSEYPLLDSPSAESIRDGQRTLRELGATDRQGSLTKIGRQLGSLPCDPRVGRMLLEANQRGCLAEVIVIAAALESRDVRLRPPGQKPQADEAHARFLDPHSDFLSFLRLWDFYSKLKSELGRSRLQKALDQRFLSFQGFREWSDIVRQLKDLLAAAGIRVGERQIVLPAIDPQEVVARDRRHRKEDPRTGDLKRPDGYAAIHQSLLSGLLSGIAERGDRHEYRAAGGLSISLWPGSGLFGRKPKWIIAAEIVETTKRYGRTVAEVNAEWIEHAAADLLKHSYYDPHWSKKAGAAMVYRRSTLYGLPIVFGHRVPYAPIDPEAARSMMIDEGLVAGQWNCHEKFYQHNQEMLADMHELSQRTRSSEFILDRFHLANFYGARIPQDVNDLTTLRSWIKKNRDQPAEQALWMKPEDLVSSDDRITRFEQAYPNAVDVGPTTLPLEYHFEPGHESDGVTITVPQAALRQISEEALGWLVPGLLEEKILHLIRSLPKSLRTNFVPAPDVAKQLAGSLADVPREQPFTAALCEAMSHYSGERIAPGDFNADKLPQHLRFYLRVVDDDGELLGSGRDIPQLQAQYAPPDATWEQTAGERGADDPEAEWVGRRVTLSDFDQLPEKVAIQRGGVVVAAFPALVDLGSSVEMRLADTGAEARRLTSAGWTRLFAIEHRRALRSQIVHLPGIEKSRVQLGHMIQSKDLTNQLQDLVARMALVENLPLITNREALEARNANAGVQISIAAQELANWLPKLTEESQALRLHTERVPESWREVFDDIQVQTDGLFPAGFLQTTPWQWLAEYPRYLKAIRLRLERLKNGGLPKDRKLRGPIEEALGSFQSLEQQSAGSRERAERLEQLRWMIEELRVSVFAQQLGTKISVSPRRIESFIDSLR